jgi:hypothetical protein
MGELGCGSGVGVDKSGEGGIDVKAESCIRDIFARDKDASLRIRKARAVGHHTEGPPPIELKSSCYAWLFKMEKSRI